MADQYPLKKNVSRRKSRLYKGLSLYHIPAPMIPVIAADWLKISINLLLVIHVIVCLLLALVVLMQRPKQEGLGAAFGAGLTDQAFGARTTDVLQKGTVYLGTLFFIITLVLAILIGKRQSDNGSMGADADSKDKTEETTPAEAGSEGLKEEKPVTDPEGKAKKIEMPTDEAEKAPEKPEVPAKDTDKSKPAAPVEKPVTPPATPVAPAANVE